LFFLNYSTNYLKSYWRFYPTQSTYQVEFFILKPKYKFLSFD